MRKSVSASFKTLVECYLDDNYLEKTPPSKVALTDPHTFKRLSSMYLGAKVGMLLSGEHDIPNQPLQEFRQSCQKFYIEGAIQIRKRFPFNDVIFEQLEVLDPIVVKAKSVPSLAALMASFPNLVNETNVQNIDTEWRLLRNCELLSEEFETPTKF